MKKILVTGANSYIGRSFMAHVAQATDCIVDELDVRDNQWLQADFSAYDTIFHVAGIAHFSKDESQKDLYYQVNTQLTADIAQKAKSDGVRQFIFMSSIIVYGDSTAQSRVITPDTPLTPSDFYGDSKWQAEQALRALEDASFLVTIIRPPMIYGKNSKGNYPRLANLAKKVPFFPNIRNERSMLHVDNLCELVYQVSIRQLSGTFFPQNKEYVCTADLVQSIARQHGKKVWLTGLFNPAIRLLFKFDVIKKMFGNLVYEKQMSQYAFDYQLRTFEESIQLTEQAR
ncbi:MAG: NAD-dependent epimerase/dehydratase family protein [Aerococcaceae bacterium]|nr:NAD-dependent epimerase/dehydratase family protein [Aerococcaceae bacterium]